MISTFIISITVLSMLTLRVGQAQTMQTLQQYDSAWMLMEYKLSELRYIANSESGFANLQNNLGGSIQSGDITYSQFNYTITWQVSDLSQSTDLLAVKKILVKVSWDNEFASSHTITASTLLAAFSFDGVRVNL